ncbi:MAG: hypothetical protein QM762_13715 [Chryseolinea sp.]
MKLYLTKQNIKTTDFILLETDGKFLKKTTGKVGKSGIGNSTLNAGTDELAIKEAENQADKFRTKGYKDSPTPTDLETRDVVFDKAKWHVNDEFPKELDSFQSYVHSGLFICWLVDKGLFEEDFEKENKRGIEALRLRQVSPTTFYREHLDGVFTSEGLKMDAIKFTETYFDFEKGKYIADYLEILDPDNKLSSLFYVADTWENYDKLKNVIDNRYRLWHENRSKE